MRLDKIEAVVRPRTAWEAVDLGFCMTQHWMWDFYRIWFAFTLPIFIAIYLITALFFEYPEIWAPLIVWWLKPLYDRIILHFFSHALFGEHITIAKMLNALPQLLFKTRLLLSLTLYRFTLTRSFSLPIWQLERSRGTVAQQRFKVLQQKTANTAMWLTIVCLHFQALIILLLYSLLFLFLPENTDLQSMFYAFIEENGILFLSIDFIFNYIALSLIEPFYVAGGFALYLNRRTHLEGWDIELTFRQIRQKVLQATVTLSVVAVVALTCFYPAQLYAQVAKPEQAKQYIEEVLQQPEFNTEEELKYWQYIGEDDSDVDLESDWTLPLSWIGVWAQLFEAMLWLTIGGAIAWLIYRILQIPATKQWVGKKTQYQPQIESIPIQQSASHLLPEHISQQAWQLWQQNQHRQSISLLYRGALARLQQQYNMAIYDSTTENESIRLVRHTQGADLSNYFFRLTKAWQVLAYRNQLPDTQEVKQLCEQWSQFF